MTGRYDPWSINMWSSIEGKWYFQCNHILPKKNASIIVNSCWNSWNLAQLHIASLKRNILVQPQKNNEFGCHDNMNPLRYWFFVVFWLPWQPKVILVLGPTLIYFRNSSWASLPSVILLTWQAQLLCFFHIMPALARKYLLRTVRVTLC